MRLNALRLQNFRQHADTRVEFDGGITGIIGPNGSGKTTILEAIAWALYGNAAARGTRDSIRFNRAPARSAVRVELDFELGGHRYRVVRGLTSAELYLDGAAQPIANSLTGVSELLQRRLGMSRAEFFNTYFTGQKELNVMAAMGPTERAQFLSRVLGYERLRTAQSLARDRRKLLVAEAQGLQSGMPDADDVARQLADADRRLAEATARAADAAAGAERARAALAGLVPRWEVAQREREARQRQAGELRVAESEEALARRDLARLDAEATELAGARAELAALAESLAPLPAARAELQQLERLAREEGRRQALTDTLRDLDEELARLADRRARLETAPALEQETEAQLGERRAALADVEARLAERHTAWVRDRQEAETKRQALRQQWQELRDQRDRLAALGPDGPCPTCTRPLGANFTSMLDMLGDQLDTVKVDGEYFKRRLDQLAEMPADVRELEARRKELQQETTALERRLARCQAASAELAQAAREHVAKDERRTQVAAELAALPTGYDPARHRRLRADVEQMAAQEQRQARLQERLARSEQVATERAAAAARLDSVAARLAALRASVAEGAAAEEGYERLRRDVEDAQAGARASELAAVQAEGDRRNAATALDGARTAERRLAEARVKLGELQRDRRLHDELDRAYGDLRTDLNFALRPELSEIASAFLAELTDDRYSELELDDQYNVIVLEDGIPKPVISGGEEDLANLVLRLAISQMIAERAGQTFSLLILDEVFGSLDESRRLNVVDLLRGLQDRFEQVILITHIESVREGVDRVVEVRYDEERGTSVVRQRDGGTEAEEADDAALAFEVAS